MQWCLFVCVYFWHAFPASCPLSTYLHSNFVPLVFFRTYFASLFIINFLSFVFLIHFFLHTFQLPEPLILFRYYNDFIGLAKESQSIIVEELEALRLSPTPVTSVQVSVDLNRVLFKIKDLLRQLPPAHYKTLQFLIEHLHR